MTTAPFGINVVCHKGDYRFAQACISSIRACLGDVPICLFIDGNFDVSPLTRAYGVQTVYPDQVSPALREWSYGYGFTKMVMFWHSPFERFLYLEADTVVWGNLLTHVDAGGSDFIVNTPHEAYTDFIVRSQYFDPDRVFEHTNRFAWEGCPLFNAGVLFGTRGLFDIDEYISLVRLKRSDETLLSCGDQGILNILVFRGAEQKRFTVAAAPLQTVVPVVPRGELEARFSVDGGTPVLTGEPTVVHWAGHKPSAFHNEVFRTPMMHYRRRAATEIFGLTGLAGEVSLLRQDWDAGLRMVLPPTLAARGRAAKSTARNLFTRARTLTAP